MTASFSPRNVDYYGHPDDWYTAVFGGFPRLVSAPSGTTAGTIVNPGVADPTGTTTAFFGSDMYGQCTLTTAGTQTTGDLRTINFNNPLPALRPVQIDIYTNSTGSQVFATIGYRVSLTSITFFTDTPLITATAHTMAWAIN